MITFKQYLETHIPNDVEMMDRSERQKREEKAELDADREDTSFRQAKNRKQELAGYAKSIENKRIRALIDQLSWNRGDQEKQIALDILGKILENRGLEKPTVANILKLAKQDPKTNRAEILEKAGIL